MDLHDYLWIARKRWLSIAVFTAIGGLLALGYSLTATKTYAATSQDYVAIGGIGADPSSAAVYSGSTFALQRVKSYVDVVDAEDVMAPVVQELGLSMTTSDLARMVSASNPPQTLLLSVTARGTDPVLVAKIANLTAVHFGKKVEALETPAGSASPVNVTQILDAAVPTAPVSPRTGLNTALGLTLGLGLGVGLAVLRERLDTTVRSLEELSQLIGGSALGWIGEDAGAQAQPLAALDQKSVRSEAFRTIRTNLRYTDVDNPLRVLAVTSAVSGEGKTTTACNLAIAMAQAGRSVCLVEADLRRPAASRYLGIEAGLGLTNVLAGEVPLEEALVRWRRGLLTVLPAGATPPNPSEMLGSQAMAALLATLRDSFDVVVLDAAPLLPVTDGAIAATLSDGALLVARFGVTTASQATAAGEALARVDGRLLGVVLNRVPSGGDGGAYGYAAYREVYESEFDDRPIEVRESQLSEFFGPGSRG